MPRRKVRNFGPAKRVNSANGRRHPRRARTTPNAPGMAEAASMRQPKQPRPAREKRQPKVLSEAEMRELVLRRRSNGVRLKAAVNEATADEREFYREVKAEGGTLAVAMVKFAVKLADPEQLEEYKNQIRMQWKVGRWVNQQIAGLVVEGHNARTDHAAELEENFGSGVQAGHAGNGGQRADDAEPGGTIVNGETGDRAESEEIPREPIDPEEIIGA